MPATQDNAAPSPTASSASDGSSSSVSTGPPRTPVSAGPPQSGRTFMNFTGEKAINGVAMLGGGGGAKSKTTRRANTAERRATHNAVERQRRETLNGRFLDLAALLSNLREMRRPSKSAIVNSSIAHMKAERRHRIFAAQQLRMMKNEADILRHELNVWRARAGVPFVEEPTRGEAFGIVLCGELEFDEDELIEAGLAEEEDDAGERQPTAESADEYALLQRRQEEHAYAEMLQRQQQQERAHVEMLAAQMQQAQFLQQAQHTHYYSPSPTIASPELAAFDNPAIGIGYDHAVNVHSHPDVHINAELAAKWAQEQQMLLQAHHQQQLAQRRESW